MPQYSLAKVMDIKGEIIIVKSVESDEYYQIIANSESYSIGDKIVIEKTETKPQNILPVCIASSGGSYIDSFNNNYNEISLAS